MGGAEHKRGELTEAGYFVGMMWPMTIIMDAKTCEMVSASRKKVTIYEDTYVLPKVVGLSGPLLPDGDPLHRKSIKILGDHHRNENVTHPPPNVTTTPLTTSAEAFNHPHQGEGMHVPEHVGIDGDGKIGIMPRRRTNPSRSV